MFCSACGSEIALIADVCPSCGRAVTPVIAGATLRAGDGVAAAAQPAEAASAASAAGAVGVSGGWARRAQSRQEPLLEEPSPSLAAATPANVVGQMASTAPRDASIFAGDLDQPGLPRSLPGRAALLTALVMTADLLVPWVTVRGQNIAPASMGPAAALLAVPLVAVIALPLAPQLRRLRLTQALPFAVGALALGFAAALWLVVGPLPFMLSAADIAPFVAVSPAIGLDLFLAGACVLLVTGFLLLPGRSDRWK